MDDKFLAKIQEAGWSILSVGEMHCVGQCPNEGCNVRISLRDGAEIPKCQGRGEDFTETTINSYDHLRREARERRAQLGLAMYDVEEIAGLADGHLLKIEKDNPSRTATVRIVVEWAEALGCELVLRRGSFSGLATSRMETGRKRVTSRRKRALHMHHHRLMRRPTSKTRQR